MTLTYRKKLTYFHDTFIEYCLEEIIRNRKKSDGIDVPHLPSSLENSLRYVSTIPILSETSSFIVLIDNFRRTYYEKSDATEIINNLFPLTHITQIKKILSEAILDAAIEMESFLDEGNSAEDISKLAAITMLKLFGHIKSGKFKIKKINKQSITEAITKKDGWLKSIFLSQTSSAKESRNYKFISEEDIQNYLKNKEARPSLSFYIRTKYNLHDDIQIVLIGKISQEIITDIDISYEGLNGYVFDSKIFRLDRAEAALTTQRKELMGFEEELEKYRNAVYQHNNLLDNHEDLIQILMKRIIELEENQMRQKALQSSNEIYFFNVERTPVDSFVGREDKLLSIHNHFTEGKKIIEIIGGLGGMGKTQTALKYVELYKSEYNYRVRWIDAESKFTIDAAYRKFAEDLEIDIEKKSDEEIAILVKTMLEKKMKQTLLIFDNVQDRALIKTYIPSSNR
ncbi:MAG: hypothetical protein N4A31_03355 [Rickettsiales bacterium]|jgi:hypothetical protein|nr:hypothetical protein [Rickettsiales bacterium]